MIFLRIQTKLYKYKAFCLQILQNQTYETVECQAEAILSTVVAVSITLRHVKITATHCLY